MTAEALLSRLTELDVHLEAAGQELNCDAPAGVMTDDLLTEMREHKEELLNLVADPFASVDDWSLSRFATSGLCRKVRSKVLGEIIILAADNADVPVDDAVVYRVAEARLLVGLPPEQIRAFHKVKVYFDGVIEQGVDRPANNRRRRPDQGGAMR